MSKAASEKLCLLNHRPVLTAHKGKKLLWSCQKSLAKDSPVGQEFPVFGVLCAVVPENCQKRLLGGKKHKEEETYLFPIHMDSIKNLEKLLNWFTLSQSQVLSLCIKKPWQATHCHSWRKDITKSLFLNPCNPSLILLLCRS